MAKLTTRARKDLPRSSFAVAGKAPKSGSYPIPHKSHARNALARASQFGTPAVKAEVRRKVSAKFPGLSKKGK
jgi:hypothetical protein